MQIPASASSGVRDYAAFTDLVPGWLPDEDFVLLDFLLRDQASCRQGGDLVEIGVFHGRTSILMGFHLTAGEELYACDLFEDIVKDLHADQAWWYDGLTQQKFEANYRQFHERGPYIVRGPSAQLANAVRPASVRFVHIDGDHDYEGVKADLQLSKTYLQPNAIVVCDDYATAHSPGVAAAVWEAVAHGDLVPFAVTGRKLYGRWATADTEHLERLTKFVVDETNFHLAMKNVIGCEIAVVGTGPARDLELPTSGEHRPLRQATTRMRAVARGVRRGWRLSV